MATEKESTIASHYNLSTTNPTEWPAELDDSEDETENRRKSKSRYSALERSASDRKNFVPGSQRTGEGKANIVQKDEQDPLGGSMSVLALLKHRGLPVEQDERLRNRFLLSSTTFSPSLFLAHAHADDSIDGLERGLQSLDNSIEKKAQSLKVLVETEFERFVRAKATIDNVYGEMRNQGVEPEVASPNLGARHSRQVSRNSIAHGRNFSSGSASGMVAPPQPSKNALRKETEYGVQGIKVPLLEVSQRAEDVWGPALGGRDREKRLGNLLEHIAKNPDLYETGGSFKAAIAHKNYERAVELYSKARKLAGKAKLLANNIAGPNRDGKASEQDTMTILVTVRMWASVEEDAKAFRKDIWKQLTDTRSFLNTSSMSSRDEHYMQLIGILLELGVEDNPIWIWLRSRQNYLKNKISAVVDRSKVEIEIMRRRLASNEAPTPQISALHMRNALKQPLDDLDTEQVIGFWKTLLTYVTKLLSRPNGLLGEIAEYWDSARSFIEGSRQKSLPKGYQEESEKHHHLSDLNVKDLHSGVVELVDLLRDALFSLFVEAPTEDISALFSPRSGATSAATTTANTPFTTTFSPSEGRVGNIDETSLPSTTTERGEGWNTLAFWPPHSNALSAVHYLGQILVLTGTGSEEMVTLAPVARNGTIDDKVKAMVSTARERCVKAICDAWNRDAENCRYLEDWLRSSDARNQTRLPQYFSSFERHVLAGLQQVLYLSDGTSKASSHGIVAPPSTNLLQMVRMQFVSSIYKALNGMLENAQTVEKSDDDEWSAQEDLNSVAVDGSVETASYSINFKDRNVRMLMTLSNLKILRTKEVNQLIQTFESSFSVTLTDEAKTIKDVFGQVDTKLFHSYTRPTINYLNKTIKDGINSSSWVPPTTRPNQVSPYVYATLMELVKVHTEVSTTVTNSGGASSSLLNEILAYIFENVCQSLLDGFKERKPNTYSLAALIQATLDTEFIAQTMSQYANNKAGEIQNSIYIELDKRTTNDARADLQKELGEMKIVLKSLREGSRNSFSCFKRQRGEKDRSKSERQSST